MANRAPDRSREVFATAGKPVYEAKHIATPTIKYEIGPLLKDGMAQPNKEQPCVLQVVPSQTYHLDGPESGTHQGTTRTMGLM
ncbi:hypothetical protein C2845_PM07G26170 [Panicum miliaceum]|uniref:Uncharacterized protein n=1 Tax=Panicum miliaceum TaxID=4540 RepID=A0A3L6SPZ2_PANMI|nr:hypothetical protein C2845_PM07G26170 [Panicum miliaceum]